MIEMMESLRITEVELSRNVHAVLAKVQEGAEIVVEQDHNDIAVIHSPRARGRLLSECIALAEARGSTTALDEGFMKDVENGIAERSQVWNPQSWE